MTNFSPQTLASTAATTADWPACEHRTLVDDLQLAADVALCRHRRVRTPGQLVTLGICDACTLRLMDSPPAPPAAPPRGCCGGSPTLLQRGWNVAVAVAQFLADGARTLSTEDYQARLEICETCDRRRGNTCTACGCNLTIKARGRAFQCPENKWPQFSETSES